MINGDCVYFCSHCNTRTSVLLSSEEALRIFRLWTSEYINEHHAKMRVVVLSTGRTQGNQSDPGSFPEGLGPGPGGRHWVGFNQIMRNHNYFCQRSFREERTCDGGDVGGSVSQQGSKVFPHGIQLGSCLGHFKNLQPHSAGQQQRPCHRGYSSEWGPAQAVEKD